MSLEQLQEFGFGAADLIFYVQGRAYFSAVKTCWRREWESTALFSIIASVHAGQSVISCSLSEMRPKIVLG